MPYSPKQHHLQQLLATGKGRRAHAMGVCGVGLSGVATLLAAAGWHIDGCDQQCNAERAGQLRTLGIEVATGHSPDHLAPSCDLLIHTAAVAADHPELLRAAQLGVTTASRGAVLATLLTEQETIVISGTHGKTTTSCFTLRLLQQLGLQPGWCIGGATRRMGHVAHPAASKAPLVVEADESDGTLALYQPSIMVITNIGIDHLEHFGSPAAIETCFATAIAHTRKAVVYAADDPTATRLAASQPHALGYGFSPDARLRLAALELTANTTSFELFFEERYLGRAELPLAGSHNALNAAAAMAAVIAHGIRPETAFKALAALDELPARRFEPCYQQDGITIINDYAHHPAEIRALLAQATLQGAKRLIALFQPHRYSRTAALCHDFATAFKGVDELLLLPVFAASETPVAGGDTTDLYRALRSRPTAASLRLAGSIDNAIAWLEHELSAGDLLLVIGAGDVVRVGTELAQRLPRRDLQARHHFAARLTEAGASRVTTDAPLSHLTTLSVGGTADWLVEAADVESLSRLLAVIAHAELPLHLLGGGSNSLISDLGIRGVVLRLAGGVFNTITRTAAERVMVGAAVTGRQLLDYLTGAGLDGIAFMERVPGTFGGWVAGNAGAYRDFIGNHIVSIEAMRHDGTPLLLSAHDAGFAYREATGLKNLVIMRAELALTTSTPAEIRHKRHNFGSRRLNPGGKRCAGSIFRNPEGDYAGRLLESAGGKELQVGAARILESHANVVIADKGATASDITTLIKEMQNLVRRHHGIELIPEVKLWQNFTTWPF